jgi:hypothetical protein
VLVQAASATTNDLGQFRVSNLAPGTYFLRASTPDTWESDDGQTAFAYATTYYPGVSSFDRAEPVTVAVGQELSAVDFSLQLGRSATVQGTMQSAAGEPLAAQTVNVEPVTRGVGGALFSSGGPGSTSTRTDARGAFEFRNLAPAEYMVSSGSAAERAALTVIVADGDVRTVSLMPRKPRALSGSVITAKASPPPFPSARLRVVPVATDPGSDLPSFTGPREAAVQGDWSFRWPNIEGRYVFRMQGLPRGWLLDAVRFNGRTVTDTALDLPVGDVDLTGLQLVLTDRGGAIEGTVHDANGNRAPDSTVIIFSADPAHWTVASRYVTAGRPDHAGRFSLGTFPSGIYRAIARDMVLEGQWEDPVFLNSLVPASVRFELSDRTTATLTLKLEPPQ